MQNNDLVAQRLDAMELQLREIFVFIKEPTEEMNLMQLRVAAYRKINSAVEFIDRLLEVIETQFETIEEDDTPSLIFLNKHQEEQHNFDLREICEGLREIRWLLIAPPENYQNESSNLPVAGGTN